MWAFEGNDMKWMMNQVEWSVNIPLWPMGLGNGMDSILFYAPTNSNKNAHLRQDKLCENNSHNFAKFPSTQVIFVYQKS